MTDTIEHRVEMSHLANGRRKAGLPVWSRRVEGIRDVLTDDDLSFEDKRDRFAEMLEASAWFKDAEEYGELWQCWDEIKDAEEEDHFDYCLNEIYDLADDERVWIG